MRTNKLKITLVLTATLLIGFALGMLTSAQIRNAHISKFRSFSSADRFVYWTIHLIDPTPDQKEKILPVIRKFASENNELRQRYRDDFMVLMKDFKKELYPMLTEEQIRRLESFHHERSGRKRGGPSPGKGSGQGHSPRRGSGPPPDPCPYR